MYFITAIQDGKNRHNKRCFGYYKDLRTAKSNVLNNVGSMNECLYSYIIIEKINEGVHAIPSWDTWFWWRNNKWEEINPPQWSNGLINWSIG